MSTNRSRWYAGGLGFTCSGCGHCCRGEGHVWVERSELQALADHLSIPVEEFSRRYVRRISQGRLALIDKANLDCVFWDDGCTVYPARPRQCRTFPFWEQNLESPGAWGRAAACCPGMNEGREYSPEEIERLAAGEGDT